MDQYIEKALAIADEVVAIRRDIHRHPEPGNQEVRTSRIVREKLEEYGVDTIETPTPTSVVATIRGNKGEGRCIALRCDLDALPGKEETGLPFSSEAPDFMHACGHDMHCAMMLGNAKLLCGLRDDFAGTVKLIFQHNEEIMPGGARELIEAGVMDGVDAILGMHIFPTGNDKCGVIGFKAGPFTAASDGYGFKIIGTGGHGSEPHKAPDPMLAAAEIIMLLQQIQSREIAPSDSAVIMMNTIKGGRAPNSIADEVFMTGNARSYTAEVRQKIKDHVFRVAGAVETLSRCKIEAGSIPGYDSCYNDEALSAFLFEQLPAIVGKDRVEEFKEPMSFGEDFSFYSTLTGVPSVLLILQAGHEGDEVYSLHNAHCSVKEEAMPYGMAAMTGAAVAYLNSYAGRQ